MKIAIYHNLPSGGGKRALYEMTRRLAERHDLDVYTLSCAEHEFCDLRPHARQHIVVPFEPLPLARRPFGRLNQGIRAVDLLRLRRLQRGLARQIDAGGYDLVFVHNCQFGASPSLLSFLETPAAYYCAEPPRGIYEPPVPRPYNSYSAFQRAGNLLDPLPGLYRRALRRLDRANVRAADLVLVNSAYSRESLYRTYGLFARVGYLGVDAGRFRPLGLPRGDFVLSVGALNPRKGYDFADEREGRYLRHLADELDLAVEFRTLIPDEELVRLYNQALLTLYAPIMEPFGFVPLESMACGTPVVGVREGGVRETVRHGETGLLTGRDAAQFAAAITRLLEDDELRERYGRQGRAYVAEEWSWERSVRELENHFEAVVQAARGKQP